MGQAALTGYGNRHRPTRLHGENACFLDMPEFPYPDTEGLIRLFFHSYLDVEVMVERKVGEWREMIEAALDELKPDFKMIANLPDRKSRWFWTEVLKTLSEPAQRMREAQTQVIRLERARQVAKRVFNVKGDDPGKHQWEQKLALARSSPIFEVASGLIGVRHAGKRYVALCPFHKDTNPSLHIYPKQNRWHCYGCGKGGDAIEFVKLHQKCGFKDAVEYLQRGREHARQGV
jgi:hypothetical protein